MTHTTEEVYSPLTQQEKLDVMKQDRKVKEQQQGQTTFKDFASAFTSENSGGRFAKINPPTVQPLPPNSPWSSEQPSPGDEASLGYSVDRVER
jgi:hypothetical protein